MDKGTPIHTESDLLAQFELQSSADKTPMLVSLATLLQCLTISRDQGIVPPFPEEWQDRALPAFIEDSVSELEQWLRGGQFWMQILGQYTVKIGSLSDSNWNGSACTQLSRLCFSYQD